MFEISEKLKFVYFKKMTEETHGWLRWAVLELLTRDRARLQVLLAQLHQDLN
jgi:hypothetical protein